MAASVKLCVVVTLLLYHHLGSCQNIKFLLVTESAQPELNSQFSQGLKVVQDANPGSILDVRTVNFTRKGSDAAYSDMCSLLNTGSYAAVIDMAWGGWIKGRQVAAKMGLPYIRVESTNHPFVMAADDFLNSREAMDAALIFSDQTQLDQSLYYIIGNSFLRIIGAHMQDDDAFNRLRRMRPRPSNYVVWGPTSLLKTVYEKARALDMLKRDTRWTLIFTDFDASIFSKQSLVDQTNFLEMKPESCCIILNQNAGSNCNCKNVNVIEMVVRNSGKVLGQAMIKMNQDGKSVANSWTCETTATSNQTRLDVNTYVENAVNYSSRYIFLRDKHGTPLIMPPIDITIQSHNKTTSLNVGTWNPSTKFVQDSDYKYEKMKRFFRIGIVLGLPWAWVEGAPDPVDGQYMNSSRANSGLKGYCIDLLQRLADSMEFNYEIVLPTDNMYGHKLGNGNWTGIVGDLITGDIDISVATLTMTTEREEVIDFVAPYFDQSGISILLRKKLPKQSIFKFMSVLKPEVWLGILGAVFVVSLLLWALDRFSPYSYRNNRDAYPDGARDFTLGESIWFALTSLTPQGGGECPKALSSRVLVAAYWLFIVLMLATFTANLAAFLTVERMQTTVQSLEELARQSRINYTTVMDSPYMEYFQNMAGAEEELYKKWKDITLNSTSDQSRYRVWDYPVREQYTHILKVIKMANPVSSPEAGFKRVEAATEGNFAFIHDASEVRYQYYKNCNFTEVGEPFAEQPLAIAVQQGSHLQKEISKTILALQKERYFEQLATKYWNSAHRSQCPVLDDSQGITLQSLGGIFLATLCGLLLSMITLAYEVWQQKKQEKNQIGSDDPKKRVMRVGTKQIQLPGQIKDQGGLAPISTYY